jgi:hypothetical protein
MLVLERQVADITLRPGPDAIPMSLRRCGASPLQVVMTILIGIMTLAFFASGDLSSWAERLGDGPFAQEARSLTERWDGAMAALGFVLPHDTFRLTVGRVLDCQWQSASPTRPND